LPGMSGFELQNHLHVEQRGIPIIFITAHADDASRQRALKSGAVEFLSKPVRRETLFKAIESAIQQ
jgi:FixJ family two-component response regulator